MPNINIRKILGAVGVVMLLVTIFGSFYTVNEGYRGVVTRNSALLAVVEPGLHWKAPFIDNVTEMSVQTRRASWENISAYSADIQQATNSLTVNYRLDAKEVGRVYSNLGADYFQRVGINTIQKRVKEAFGRYSAADIVKQREKVSDEIETALREDFLPMGIILEHIQIDNVDFSDEYEHAAEAAAKAEADVKRAKQELEKARVDAERQVADAEAKAKAVRAGADAEAYRNLTTAKAESEAIKMKGTALRENNNLVELTLAERWDGKLPVTMVPGATVPFINVK